MTDRVRRAAWVALAVQPAFAAYWLIAGAVEPGYSPQRQFVSELGAPQASNPWLLDASLVIWGASIALLGWALHQLAPRRTGLAGVLLLGGGVALALAGPVHLDCWASVHPHCAGAHSAAHRAHDALAWIGQTGLTLSAVALAWGLRDRALGKVLAVIGGVGFVLWVVSWFGSSGHHGRYAGLNQRIGIASAQTWVLLVAVGVLVAADRRVSATSRA